MIYKSKSINIFKNNVVFHIYKPYSQKKNNKITTCKKVQFQNCNEIIMKKILLKNKKIKPYIIKKQNTNVSNIKQIIQHLKESGFTSSIKVFGFSLRDSNSFTLSMKINPIVKKISIVNYKKLQIPSEFLKYLFKKQMGIPKSYQLINENLKTIYSWYQSRGFAWVNIELIEQNQPNNISLKIFEGVIKDIYLTCKTKNIPQQKVIQILNILIQKELGISSGSILNTKTIEAGIKRLTNLHLIKDCNYKVKRNQEGLIVIINYDILNNRIAYFYNYNTILTNYSSYKRISNLLNKNISKFDIFKKFKRYSSIINTNQSLGFKYHSLYSNKKMNSISVNFSIKQYYPQLNILFNHPYIYKQQKIVNNLIINFYNIMIKTNIFYPFILFKPNYLNQKQVSNLAIDLYNTKILLKHNLLKNMSILEKFWTITQKYQAIDIQVKDYNNFLIQKNSIYDIKLLNIKKFAKSIRNILTYIKVSITYNTIYFGEHFKAGKLLKIYSQLCTCLTSKKDTSKNELIYLGQNIGFKYMQVFNLPKICKYIYYNKIIFFLQCSWLIHSKTSLLMFHKPSLRTKSIYFKGSYHQGLALYSFSLCNVEYHISQSKHFSMYLLCNCITYLYSKTQHMPIIGTENPLYTKEVNIGSGIKFYLPIKKMPNIRLEYAINNKNEHFFRLRTDSKYNN